MKNKKKIPYDRIVGTVFEGVAEKVLKEKGYKILERNYVYGKYEIDIIAKKDDEIVFAEVKSRNKNSRISPEKAVGREKALHILKASAGYIKELSFAGIDVFAFRYSFDVIGILYDDSYDLKAVKYFKSYYRGDRDEILRFAL